VKAARYLIASVITALFVAPALPAAAVTTTDLVRVSTWSASVEVRGLDGVEADQITDLWAEFVAGIPAHAGCLLASPPSFEAKWDMPPRAAYAPATATLYVKPGDLERLVVFHELGHHLDFACGGAEAVGAELRAAQGIAASKPWWNHGSPVTWPAEYFANAVAIALGEESRHGVTAEAVGVVEEWLGRTRPAAPEPVGVLTFGEPGPDVPRLA
jgi:hypothetical protein